MKYHPSRNPALFVSLAAGLAVLLAAGLILALAGSNRVQASSLRATARDQTSVGGEIVPDGRETFGGEEASPLQVTPADGLEAPLQALGGAGIITWTFDLNNMGWISRDMYDDYGGADWANGAIYKSFTNRTFSSVGPENFAAFRSPRLDPPLSGTGGSISFKHTQSAWGINGVQFSVCLHYSTAPNPLPMGYLPCTAWRPVTESQVTFRLGSYGTWNSYDFMNVPIWTAMPTPVTEKALKAILKEIRGISVYYMSQSDLCVIPKQDCLHTSTIAIDDVRLEVTGIVGKLGASTRYAQDGDRLLFYGAVEDDRGEPIRRSNEVSMTLTGKSETLQMFDSGTSGDAEASDGVYSRWETLAGEGVNTATLYSIAQLFHPFPPVYTEQDACPASDPLFRLTAAYQCLKLGDIFLL